MARKNVSNSRLAERYTNALFPLADEGGKVDLLAGEMAQLGQLIRENAEFAELAASPTIAAKAKSEIVRNLLEGWKADALTVRFAMRVAEAGRMMALPEIATRFAHMAAKKRGEVEVEIVSAKELTAEQQRQLEQSFGTAVTARVTVDPSLIAGVILKSASKQLDYSLAGKLRQIRAAATGELQSA